MKNGGKNKSVAFIIFCLVYIHSPATSLGTSVQLLGNTNC